MGGFLAGWVEAERGRFVLLLPVGMAAAILGYFGLKQEPPLWLGWALPAAAMAGLAACWRWPPARLVAAVLLAASLGFARAEWRTAAEPPLMNVPFGVAVVAGRIGGVDLLPAGRRVLLDAVRLNGGPVQARSIRVRLRSDDPAALAAGDDVTLEAELFKPDRPAYPGGWDSGRDAFFAGRGASGFALSDVTLVGAGRENSAGAWLRRLREGIAGRILLVLPVSTGSVAVTLLTGFQQDMPAAERQQFVTAGLAHILAVAGLHVGIVMGLVFAASRYLFTRSEFFTLHFPAKALAAIAALLAGAGYAALTGAHLPILRSLAMASLVTLGVLAGRRAISLRGLALAALAIMLATPDAVVGVSFQMSFSAVLALISGYAAAQPVFTFLYRQTSWWARPGGHVAALAYTSLLAGGASMPFAAYQFQQIQPYWIFANLIAVPLAALWIMPWGMAALALMPLHLEALALLPMAYGIRIVLWLIARIALWPGATMSIEPVPDAAMLLFSAGLIWLCLWRSRGRLAGLGLMLAAGLVYAAARPPDVLVSPDAKLLAVRAPAGLYLLRQPKASNFTLAQWQPVWAGAGFTGMECTGPVCLDTAQVRVVAAPPLGGCGAAMLILAPVPLRGACDAPGRLVVDRFTVWREGAVAIWFGRRGMTLRTDREMQGVRPWVPAWPVSTR